MLVARESSDRALGPVPWSLSWNGPSMSNRRMDDVAHAHNTKQPWECVTSRCSQEQGESPRQPVPKEALIIIHLNAVKQANAMLPS